MSLIKCNECGKEVSDKASACPNCGCPIEFSIKNDDILDIENIKTKSKDQNKKRTYGIFRNYYEKDIPEVKRKIKQLIIPILLISSILSIIIVHNLIPSEVMEIKQLSNIHVTLYIIFFIILISVLLIFLYMLILWFQFESKDTRKIVKIQNKKTLLTIGGITGSIIMISIVIRMIIPHPNIIGKWEYSTTFADNTMGKVEIYEFKENGKAILQIGYHNGIVDKGFGNTSNCTYKFRYNNTQIKISCNNINEPWVNFQLDGDTIYIDNKEYKHID